jgi:hypothetical protein
MTVPKITKGNPSTLAGMASLVILHLIYFTELKVGGEEEVE